MIINVNELNTEELQIYAVRNEIPLKRMYEPEPGLFIAETPNVIVQALKADYKPVSMLVDEHYLQNPGVYGDDSNENPKRLLEIIISMIGDEIPVYSASSETFTKINGLSMARGILCAMRRRKLSSVADAIKGASRVAVLDDVENPTNVGALFRSAAALGFDALILSHGSSDPLYRRAARVSMGSVFMLPWAFSEKWAESDLPALKAQGFKVISMALHDNSIDLGNPILKEHEKLAVVFGNEANGVSKATLEQSDYIAKIPMLNGIDSLNVAAAGAVTFWELRKLKND